MTFENLLRSIDSNTYYVDPNPSIPPKLKSSTYSRSDDEPQSCFQESSYWDPGPGHKKLCLINRWEYFHKLGAPIYPCELNPAGPYGIRDHTPNTFGKLQRRSCGPDLFNGTKGKKEKFIFLPFTLSFSTRTATSRMCPSCA